MAAIQFGRTSVYDDGANDNLSTEVKYFTLVWAALWRRPAESLLTFLAVAAAFTLFSMMTGINLTVRQIVAHSRTDRLWVDPRFPDATSFFGLPLAMGGQLARIDGVSGVGARRWLNGYHVDPHHPVGILLMDEGMRGVWREGPITPAQWNTLFATPAGVFVSVKAAAKWALKAGEVFTVITGPGTRLDGGTSWDFQVLGVVPDDWDWSSDDGFILGNAHYMDNAVPLAQRGQGFMFEVAVNDPDRALEISEQIDLRFLNSGASTLTTSARMNTQSSVNGGVDTAALTTAIAAAGLGMILFLTGNAIARSVRERLPEFAVLETLGFRQPHLMSLVFVEAAVPCLLGAALGAAAADVLGKWSTHFLPGNLTRFLSQPVPVFSVLAWALGSALLLAMASSAIPIFRLRYLSITDALAGR